MCRDRHALDSPNPLGYTQVTWKSKFLSVDPVRRSPDVDAFSQVRTIAGQPAFGIPCRFAGVKKQPVQENPVSAHAHHDAPWSRTIAIFPVFRHQVGLDLDEVEHHFLPDGTGQNTGVTPVADDQFRRLFLGPEHDAVVV